MFERIAIVGAGAMGTLLGAMLNRSGVPAELVDVDRPHVEALNRNGASVTGTVEFTVPVKALTPEEMTGEYDLIFLLIKQVYNAASFPQLRPHLAPEGTIVTLQNGMPELAVAEAFGEDRTMGCAVTWAATLQGPGVTRCTAEYPAWHNNLGRLDGAVTEKGEAVRKILAHVCPTTLTEDLAGIRWAKMVVNCAFSGVAAALGCTFGELVDEPEALRCAQYVARECVRVSRARGVKMAPLGPEGSFDPLADFGSEDERRARTGFWRELFRGTRNGKSSILQDLERGRPSEIHAINGVLCAEGRRCGAPSPWSDTVVALVAEAEAAGTVPTMENLARFPGGGA